MTPKTDLRQSAIKYLEMGIPVIPISGESKTPLVKWKAYQDRLPTREEAAQWPWEAIGVLTGYLSGYVVVDCDTDDSGAFWRAWRPWTPMVAKTRRGWHFFYQIGEQHIGCAAGVPLGDGLSYDVRGQGGYVLAEPSKNYRFLSGIYASEQLPLFNPSWRPSKEAISDNRVERTPPAVVYCHSTIERRILERALRDAANGRNRAGFEAALQLRDNGFPKARAEVLLVEQYQTQVATMRHPIYSADETRRSVDSAYQYPVRKCWS